MTNPLTTSDYWDQVWSREIYYNPDTIHFKDIFSKYIKPGNRCFEVGCFPGRYMIFLAQTYQCKVSGLDHTAHFERMKKLFEQLQVMPENLYNEDFLTFQPSEQYDFVYSLGFLEHFVNFEDVIVRHIRFVRPGGLLFLEAPNYRSPLRYPMHAIFDRQDLKRHHLPAIDLRKWERVLTENGMTILQQGYSGTVRLWFGLSDHRTPVISRLLAHVAHISRAIDRRIKIPNRWTSPYLISISVK